MYIFLPLYCTCLSYPAGGMCPDEVDNVWGIQWPDTTAGSSLSVSCVKNNEELGMANRLCNGSGVWDTVDAVDCESAAGNEIRMKVYNDMYIYDVHLHLWKWSYYC